MKQLVHAHPSPPAYLEQLPLRSAFASPATVDHLADLVSVAHLVIPCLPASNTNQPCVVVLRYSDGSIADKRPTSCRCCEVD